jgi:hypothetical protein
MFIYMLSLASDNKHQYVTLFRQQQAINLSSKPSGDLMNQRYW